MTLLKMHICNEAYGDTWDSRYKHEIEISCQEYADTWDSRYTEEPVHVNTWNNRYSQPEPEKMKLIAMINKHPYASCIKNSIRVLTVIGTCAFIASLLLFSRSMLH